MDLSAETRAALTTPAHPVATRHRKRPLAPGATCYNCGTVLHGHWCHVCGQAAENFHRSTLSLVGEFAEHLFDADGRLAQTIPRLLLRPAALTRDYLEGRRAPQVPPLRLFLVVLLIVFLAGELIGGGHTKVGVAHLDAGDQASLQHLHISLNTPWDDAISAWMRVHLTFAVAHPDELVAGMWAWAHDFAFLALPISGFILAGMFVLRRRFVLFDHLVFSMHSLAFQGLLFCTAMAGQAVVGPVATWLFALSPVHLFVHMRGVYGTGKIGTLVRMAILFALSAISFGLLMAALVLVGLAALKT